MKILIPFLAIAVVNFAYADDRGEFFGLVQTAAEQSASQPLKCKMNSLSEGERDADFVLTVEKGDPSLKDSFFVRFHDQRTQYEFSTLVAYEAHNGVVLGRLQIHRTDDWVDWVHTFDGFFDDVLSIRSVQSSPTRLTYEKLNPQGVAFQTIECDL